MPIATKTSVALEMCIPLNPKSAKNIHYVCKVNECNSTLSAAKGSNILVHMRSHHSDIFNERWAKAQLAQVNGEEMEIRRMELIQNLTELVTKNGRPLALLFDSGMQKIIWKEVNALKKSGYGNGFTSGDNKCPPVVLEHINHVSFEIIKSIKLEVKDTLLSLMVDIGSRNGRDILGISIQYMHEARIIIRSLGMILLNESHTAVNIKNKILACLQLFEIKPAQIISITTDNASNMLAMIKSFNRDLDENCDDSGDNSENFVNEENDFLFDTNNQLFNYDNLNDEIERIVNEYHAFNSLTHEEIEAERRNAEASEILEDSSHYLDMLKDLQNEFVLHTLNTSGIKCAAHTLQLAIKNALKSSKVAILINLCRMACKLMRKTSYKNILREYGLKEVCPRLDCTVRWNSTFIMVEHTFFLLRLSFGYIHVNNIGCQVRSISIVLHSIFVNFFPFLYYY